MLLRALVLFSAAALLPAASKIVGGPVAVNVTARTATIVWVVQTDELTLHPPSGPAKQSPSLHVERTTLTGLQPNTRYQYDAGGPDGVKGSFKRSFQKTAVEEEWKKPSGAMANTRCTAKESCT